MIYKKQYILAKEEATYGVDPTPTEASNAILCSNIAFNIDSDFIDFQHVSNYMGRKSASYLNTIMTATISFDVELKGEGAALGVAPEIGALLKACQMSETIVGATSVTYAPISLAMDDATNDSVTIYYHQDLIRHEINGARGTWTMSGEAIPPSCTQCL